MAEETGNLVRARNRAGTREALTPEAAERKRAYSREYMRARRRTPEGMQAKREYAQRPEAKQAAREYNQRPEVKQRLREYRQRPDVKQRDRDRKRQGAASWASRHPEIEKARHLYADYGLGLEVWNRMWREQGGLCAICRRAAATHVDHDHQTGRVRSLLCRDCNTAIGRFGDDPAQLRAAADYLEHHAAQEAPYVQERLFDA